MEVIRIEVGPLATNAYLLKGHQSGLGAVVDPGEEGERISDRCRREGIEPLFIINTHGHVDHVGADAELKAAFPEAALCIGAEDAGRLRDPIGSLSALFGPTPKAPAPDVLLEDGQELEFGEAALRVLAAPGHTPGAVCLLAWREEPPQLFCGDLVFQGSVGRTDLPGGSAPDLEASIERVVLSLPDEAVIWPGHGPPTTVGAERRGNPYLRPARPARP